VESFTTPATLAQGCPRRHGQWRAREVTRKTRSQRRRPLPRVRPALTRYGCVLMRVRYAPARNSTR
jgi:hypothetical protein